MKDQYKIVGYNFGRVTNKTPEQFEYQTIVAYYYVKKMKGGKKTMIWNPNKATILDADRLLEELPEGYVKKIIHIDYKEKSK